MSSPTGGALHHVFFFLENAPAQSGLQTTDAVACDRTPTTSNTAVGQTADGDSWVVVTPQASEDGNTSHAFATAPNTPQAASESSTQIPEAMIPSMVAAGQSVDGHIPPKNTPADCHSGDGAGEEFLDEAARILTAASTHFAAPSTSTAAAQETLERIAQAVKDRTDSSATDTVAANVSDQISDSEVGANAQQPGHTNGVVTVKPSDHAAEPKQLCPSKPDAVQADSHDDVKAQKEPERSKAGEAHTVTVEPLSEPDQTSTNLVRTVQDIAADSMEISSNSKELFAGRDSIAAHNAADTAIVAPTSLAVQDPKPATSIDVTAAASVFAAAVEGFPTSEPPATLNTAMATTSGASSPPKTTVSRPATEAASKPKQSSLIVNIVGDGPAKSTSRASSPSKSPLSVTAAEFVPFGPAPPPTNGFTAAAAEFVPAKVTPIAHRREPQRKTAPAKPILVEQKPTTNGKGIGTFAIKRIPLGTRIICEAPLVQIPFNDVSFVWGAYFALPQHKKKIYNSLHCFSPAEVEQETRHEFESRGMSKRDIDNHLKVMGIFNANDFILADQSGLAVFETISRINHACVPNVHFSNNGELGKETVHAARDIEEGEELVANYIGGRANYQPRHERQEYLIQNYGFLCQCKACSGANPESDARRETLSFIVWGLNQYKYRTDEVVAVHGGNPFFPASPAAALRQAEDAFRLLIIEGLVTTELAKAYRFASDFALDCGQYEKALQYAFYEGNIERNIFGGEVGDLKQRGLASDQWITKIQLRMDEDGIPIPGAMFWANYPGKQTLWYNLRKAEKDRVELAERVKEQQKIKNAKKRNKLAEKRKRTLAAKKRAMEEEKNEDMKEMDQLDGHEEDKENSGPTTVISNHTN